MSLVAYGSSDESESEGEENGNVSDSTSKQERSDSQVVPDKTVTNNPNLSTNRYSNNVIQDKEPSNRVHVQRSSLFSSLPAPKHRSVSGSDDEFFDDEGDKSEAVEDNLTKNDDNESITKPVSGGLHMNLPAPKHTSATINTVDELRVQKSGLFSSLPAPRKTVEILDEEIREEELDPIHIKKDYSTIGSNDGSRSAGAPIISKKQQPVKIVIPSLSEFQDEDEKDTEPAAKKLKPSSKGSGLFALLPAPKSASTKEANRKLVPNVLTKKPSPAVKKLPQKPKSKSASQLTSYAESGDESDEEASMDFFSLTSKSDDVDLPSVSSVLPEPIIPDSVSVPDNYQNDKPLSFRTEFKPATWSAHASNSQAVNSEWHQNSVVEAPEPSVSEPVHMSEGETTSNAQLDEEAMQRLCGRRERHKDVQFIDVSGDSVMPDANEWLTKQLTEEKETRSHSHRKKDGPTMQQRRKHQITYLAFQAKERELELKNQWAQNRMSRKQTQAKYGF